MAIPIVCTDHARYRQAQRNLSDLDLSFVVQYGCKIHSAGVVHFFLGRRDLPADKHMYRQFAHLEGTTVVAVETGNALTVITAYRNRRASRRIRNKEKYDRTSCRRKER